MKKQNQELDPKVLEALQTQYLRVQNPAAANKLWDWHLNDKERQQLGGDLEGAYRQHAGTVGMWKKVRGGSGERALVEVAHALGFLDDPSFRSLLGKLGESIATDNLRASIPVWRREVGQLMLDGQVIRAVKRRHLAKNVVAVLDAFQEEEWPPAIKDPLRGGQNRQRLYRTISALNEGLSLIKFHADGTGQGFAWRHL